MMEIGHKEINIMKRKLLLLFAVILAFISVVCTFSFFISAKSATAPTTVAIEKFNLVFEDNVYLKYAVKFDNVDDRKITASNIGMLHFTSPQSDYTVGNEIYSSRVVGYTMIDGQKYYTFEYRHITAKQMTDYIYSVAYIDIDGEKYYSEPVKYSVLEYAYLTLGKTGNAPSSNEELKEMLANMLEYGASAQKYFSYYKVDRLANADWFEIKLVEGTFNDGFTHGLYLPGDKITMIAPLENENGVVFSHWVNSEGLVVSEQNPFTTYVGIKSEVYTPVYTEEESNNIPDYLALTLLNDGSVSVKLNLSASFPIDIEISKTYNGFLVTEIDAEGFRNCQQLRSVIIPEGVNIIGEKAFENCGALKYVSLGDGVVTISEAAFNGCSNLDTVKFGSSVSLIDTYAFYGTPISSLVFESNISQIGEFAFRNCNSLKSIIFNGNALSIGKNAFEDCDALKEITFKGTVESIESAAFNGPNALEHVYYFGSPEEWANVNIANYNTSFTTCIYFYSESEPIIKENYWHYDESGNPIAW